MVADNYVTYKSVSGKGSSRYVKEIITYVEKTLNLSEDDCLISRNECSIVEEIS